MENETCSRCKFWRKPEPSPGVRVIQGGPDSEMFRRDQLTFTGACLRYPRAEPKHEGEWCGEFKEREDPQWSIA